MQHPIADIWYGKHFLTEMGTKFIAETPFRKVYLWRIVSVYRLILACQAKEKYLAIVEELAKQRGLEEYIDQLKQGAEQWAIARGGTVTSLCTSIYEFSRSKNKIGKKCLTDNLYK